MRHLRPILAGFLGILLLAACSEASPGWTYAPAPSPTVAPSPGAESPAPTDAVASPAPTDDTAGSPAPTDDTAESPAPTSGGGELVQVSALNIAFDQGSLTVPADTPLQIEFANNDPGIPHNVEIRDSGGTSLFVGDIFNGVETRVYDAPALPAGQYTWICTVHPNMVIDVTAE